MILKSKKYYGAPEIAPHFAKFDLDSESSYLAQDFIDNELPYYQNKNESLNEENVDSDIYIDRGINAAFEKHLKLGEVTSLEALEQYGNGYFKIMES